MGSKAPSSSPPGEDSRIFVQAGDNGVKHAGGILNKLHGLTFDRTTTARQRSGRQALVTREIARDLTAPAPLCWWPDLDGGDRGGSSFSAPGGDGSRERWLCRVLIRDEVENDARAGPRISAKPPQQA